MWASFKNVSIHSNKFKGTLCPGAPFIIGGHYEMKITTEVNHYLNRLITCISITRKINT